jgi:NAD(P)-dependent dehydrogenase (short-subunit alcohol dehydrogenase family)
MIVTQNAPHLTAETTIADWLDDPIGGALFAELLAQGGQTPDSLRPVRNLTLGRLVTMSQGAFPQEMVDVLVARAAAGDVPSTEGAASAAPVPAQPARPRAPRVDWVEKVTEGRFTGKTVVITGAGSGIGRAVASRVAREGGRVIAVDISTERLDDFAASLPDADIVSVAGDITDDASVAAIVEAAGDRIDALANVAGIMDDMMPVHEISDDIWNRVFAINVTGTMKLMRAVVPVMLPRGTGSIVNVASEAALRGSAAGAAYTASKHAVAGLTKSSAFMYTGTGIRVNAVAPGPTITNIEARFGSELGAERVRLAMTAMPDAVEPDALAASITFLLSDDAVNLNGVILPSDGGWSAV